MTTTDQSLAEVVLGSARGRHAFEDCVERLGTAIRLGVYPYGTSLPPERELAAQMGISRATLREAIAALRTANMVRTTRGRGGGTVVDHPPATPGEPEPGGRPRQRSELMDSLVFRRVVEPGACYLAATRTLSGDHQDLLRDALQAVDQATDPAEHRQADSRLHLAIAAVTESPQLIDAVAGVQGNLHSMLIAIPVLKVNIEHSDAQHADIVDAILCGDANRHDG